jgi:hypothetical protein
MPSRRFPPPWSAVPSHGGTISDLAVVLTVAFTTGYLPRDATASHNETNGTVNVLDLQYTSDAKVLPRQDILDEVYR